MPTPPSPTIAVLQHPIKGNGVLRQIERPSSYQHKIGAWLGYDSAKFSLETTEPDLNFWFWAVGKRVQVHSHSLEMIWDGFIDQVKIDVGPVTYTIGPLMDVCNNLLLVWSAKVPRWANPTGTTWHQAYQTARAADSQARYGNLWHFLNIGAQTPDGADAASAGYFENRRYPKPSWDVRDRSQAPSVKVDCKGWIYYLDRWYEDTWADWSFEGGTAYASDMIHDILTGNPNSTWLDLDESHITANTAYVPASQPFDMSALEKIKEILGYGDGDPDYNRWLFYMGNDFNLYYHAAPTEIEYEIHLEDDRFSVQLARAMSEARVQPWDVKPGRWALLSDFLPGLTLPDDYPRDPRLGFIEQVVYTAPQGLQLKGADFDRLEQVLAHWGLQSVLGGY